MGSMEVQKRSSKGGSFLNLFDWNGKSRKKLFSDNSETRECTSQERIEPRILPRTRLVQTNSANENASSFSSGRIDWNSNPSSVSGEGHGARAPGVVARLMGLDSMPTPDPAESCSPSFPDFNTPRGSPYYNKPDAFTRDPRIERFQTEILPPRSAKPISLTHHKLLSPVKNPAYIPTKNAAYIIEAAARIIEASPKEARVKVSPSITSSVPLRIQDLKAKLEGQQPMRPSNFQIMNGKSNDRSPQKIIDARTNRRVVESGKCNIPRSSSGKARLLSPADQTKANMQRKEGKSKTFNRDLSTDRGPKSSPRRISTTKGTPNVLKQNNQKQNSVAERISSVSKASSGLKFGRNEMRTVKKVPVRSETLSLKTVKTSSVRNLSPSTSTKTLSPGTGKGVSDREISSTRSIATNVLISNDERSMKSKIGADVISFTFTSPIKGSLEAQSPVRAVASVNNFASGKSLTFSSPAESVIGESSLSTLLEKKLRELKDRLEAYGADSSCASTPSLKEEDNISTCTSTIFDASARVRPNMDKISSLKFQAEVAEDNEECSYDVTGSKIKVDHRFQSVSDLEPLYTAESSPASTVTCVEYLEVEDSRTELSETTSCSSVADVRENYAILASSNFNHFNQSSNWEIGYISDIIGEAELMLVDRATAHLGEIIDPSLFEELENRGNRLRNNSEDESDKLKRKVLFDFVSECLVLRCQDLLIGTPKGWASFEALFQQKSLLADEIYRQLSRGNCIGDMMVDVLVEEDMSSKYGRWIDFRVEIFEEGMEIGQGILSSLVDEMVAEYVMPSC